MNRIFKWALAAILFCGSLQANAQNNDITLYFSAEEMSELIKCLPSAPCATGADLAHDIMRFMWGKTH